MKKVILVIRNWWIDMNVKYFTRLGTIGMVLWFGGIFINWDNSHHLAQLIFWCVSISIGLLCTLRDDKYFEEEFNKLK